MKLMIHCAKFIALLATSCAIVQAPTLKTYVIGNVTLSESNKMKFVSAKGVDSYLAYFITEKNDTLIAEYGNQGIVDNLDEFGITAHVFPLENRNIITKQSGKEPSEDEALFSKYPEEDEKEHIFCKNFFMYDTINSIVVKIVQPKRVGKGATGMYVPELKNGKCFSIYGINLDSVEQRAALEMFKTLHIRDNPN